MTAMLFHQWAGWRPAQHALGDAQPTASTSSTLCGNANAQFSRASGLVPRRRSAPCQPPAPSRRTCTVTLAKREKENIWRRAERDLLPGGVPNTPWRRISYQLKLAPTAVELWDLYLQHRWKGERRNWGALQTADTLTRLVFLLYPKAVAGSADAEHAHTDPTANPRTGRPDPRQPEGMAVQRLLQSLGEPDGLTSKPARQTQGFHLARLLVVLAWMYPTGVRSQHLASKAIHELLRCRGQKLATVAALDPVLFARMVRAVAMLAPGHAELWGQLQRLSLAALAQAAAAGTGAHSGGGGDGGSSTAVAAKPKRERLWGHRDAPNAPFGGEGLDQRGGEDGGGGVEERAQPAGGAGGEAGGAAGGAAGLPRSFLRPLPDMTSDDLCQLAFGFAAAGHALPRLFSAIQQALLSRPLPTDPELLANLLWSYARAKLRPGWLGPKVLEAYLPLLQTAPPRPTGRLLWSMGILGLRDERVLAAASASIVSRDLVFGSPQELVNVVWAFARLGWCVEQGPRGRGKGQQAQEEGSTVDGAARRRRKRGPREAPAGGGARSEDGRGNGEEDDEDGEGAWDDEEEEEAAWASASPSRLGSGDGATAAGPRQAAYSWGAAVARRPSGAVAAGVGHGLVGLAPGPRSSGRGQAQPTGQPEQGAEPEGAAQQQQQQQPDVAPAASPAAPAAALPGLRPLPLQVVLDGHEARGRALAHAPLPDPASPHGVLRHLARCFLKGRMGASTLYVMSTPQLSVLAAAFARCGYGSKPLFYTLTRMAVRRAAALTPRDVALLLPACARMHVHHQALFEVGCAIALNRMAEFPPADLAEVLWAVQCMHARDLYPRLAEAVRRERYAQAGEQAVPGWNPYGGGGALAGGGYGGAEADAWVPPEVMQGGGRGGGMGAWVPRKGTPGGVLRAQATYGPVLQQLHVPRHLLDDPDWGMEDEYDSELGGYRSGGDSSDDEYGSSGSGGGGGMSPYGAGRYGGPPVAGYGGGGGNGNGVQGYGGPGGAGAARDAAYAPPPSSQLQEFAVGGAGGQRPRGPQDGAAGPAGQAVGA